MLKDMPTVKCVFLAVDGKQEERLVDLAPEANQVSKLLGGDGSFVGMYPSVDVIIMNLRNPPKSAKVNKCKLPMPFDGEKIKGPMLLVRMVDAIPKNFTMEEWKELVANPPVPEEEEESEEEELAELSGEEDEDDVEEEEEEGEEDSDEEDGTAALEGALKMQVAAKFEEENGREASEEELESMFSQFKESGNFEKAMARLAAILGPASEEEDDEDEDDEEAEDISEEEKENVENQQPSHGRKRKAAVAKPKASATKKPKASPAKKPKATATRRGTRARA